MPSISKHEQLSNPQITFSAKLKLAVSFDLEYWELRTNPPNIPKGMFSSLIQMIPDTTTPVWKPRKSTSGDHGSTGEDMVFNFDFLTPAMGKAIVFYCKGYFFDKGDLKGVTIQSFRPLASSPVIPIRRPE